MFQPALRPSSARSILGSPSLLSNLSNLITSLLGPGTRWSSIWVLLSDHSRSKGSSGHRHRSRGPHERRGCRSRRYRTRWPGGFRSPRRDRTTKGRPNNPSSLNRKDKEHQEHRRSWPISRRSHRDSRHQGHLPRAPRRRVLLLRRASKMERIILLILLILHSPPSQSLTLYLLRGHSFRS